MALTVGELNARLGLDSGPFLGGLASSQAAASRGALAIGAALAGGAAVALKAYVDFDSGIREVFTLLPGASEQAKEQMVDDVKAFAEAAGRTTSEVLPALYQALSSGVPPENVFDFLQVANEAAVGGVTDLQTAVNGLSSVVNAYGAEVLPASQASDLLFTAVRLGKTTFSELSDSVFQVVPIASAVGVSFQDVAAALATVTLQGTPTSVAATQIRGAIAEMGKAGQVAYEHFEHAAGVSFPEFIEQGGTLGEALSLMEQYADRTGVSVMDLFGSIEAGQAALSLTGENASTFSGILDEMAGSAGATRGAFDEMDAGIGRGIDRIKAKISVLAVDLGETLAPAFVGILDLVSALSPVLSVAAKAIDSLTHGIGLAVPAVLLASKGFTMLNAATSALAVGAPRVVAGVLSLEHSTALAARSSGGLTGKLGGLLGAINPVGLAVGAAIIGFMAWSKAKQEARKRAQEFEATLDEETGAITDNTRALVENILVEKDLLGVLNDAHISLDVFLAAITGDTEALARLEQQMRDAVDAGRISESQAVDLSRVYYQQADAAEKAAESTAEKARADEIARGEAVRAAGAEERLEQAARRRGVAARIAAQETSASSTSTRDVVVGDLNTMSAETTRYVRDMRRDLAQLIDRTEEVAARTQAATRLVGDAFGLLPGLIRKHGGDVEAAMEEVLSTAKAQRDYENNLHILAAAGLGEVVSMLEESPDREAAISAAAGFAADLATAADVNAEIATQMALTMATLNPSNQAWADRYRAAAAAWQTMGAEQRAAYLAGLGTLPPNVPSPGTASGSGGEHEARAGGGPVRAGRAYLVGEYGRPEIFVPEENGRILPEISDLRRYGGEISAASGEQIRAAAAPPTILADFRLTGDVSLDGWRLGELALAAGQRQILLRTGIRSD